MKWEESLSQKSELLFDNSEPPKDIAVALEIVARALDEIDEIPNARFLAHVREKDSVPIVLGEEELIFGRSSETDYSGEANDDRRFSRKHFSVHEENGEMMLRDLDSTNGTWIGKRRVKERRLRPGDIVQAGNQLFAYIDSREI